MEILSQVKQYTDFEIVSLIKEGEIPAYEILIRRYNSSLYKIGRAYGYNHQDTEDLIQDTYVSAFFNLSKFENRSAFKTWLTRIMLNNCYQKRQKFSFSKQVLIDNEFSENDNPMFQKQENSERAVINRELGRVMENALQQIPADYRMVFTLRELNGLSVLETADALDITESNVKVRLTRAKKMLRFEIEKMYSPEDIFEFNLIYCDRIVERVMSEIKSQKEADF
ncbi:sigma-70 family RNA polymerase sigma factor [Rubrolithibacter danxiaensis]|uniref:sigma-70 family RNA polymerase sigma factor n=1 Tax=Rubrolithibacter danxiaensis TaxID=3390805 RepID=UPI003BF80E18